MSRAIRYVQILNPQTGFYTKIDLKRREIIDQKQTYGPYPDLPIVTSLNHDNSQKICSSCGG